MSEKLILNDPELPEASKETAEKIPDTLFKITLIRHEKTNYTEEGDDLTEDGAKDAYETGEKLKESGFIDENDDLQIFHSPQARAAGTARLVAEGAELTEVKKRTLNQIRQSDIPDWDTFVNHVEELSFDHERVAEAHHNDLERFENSPEFIEPISKKRTRLYKALEYLIRNTNKPTLSDKTPHLIAVSHYEIITLLIDDVFGIETMESYHSPSHGEVVYITGKDSGENKKTLLEVTFRGETKEVYFNSNTRSIEQI